MRGDWYREQSDHYESETMKLRAVASTKEEWEAAKQMRSVSQYLFSIGGWLDLHDEKYPTKKTTS